MNNRDLEKKAIKEICKRIREIFKESRNEVPIYSVKLEKHYCPNMLQCYVAFKEGNDYYYPAPSDPCCFITSENFLSNGNKKIKNTPLTIDKMNYFETTLYPENILDSDKLYKKLSKDFQVKRMSGGLVITTCKKR